MKIFQDKSYLLVVLFLYISLFGRIENRIVDEVKYNEEVCNESVDLYVLVDGSGSIGYANWIIGVTPMLDGLIKNLNISRDSINLYMNLFANRSRELIRLGSGASIDKTEALKVVHNLRKTYVPYGTTNLSSALYEVLMHLKDKVNRENAIQLVIILTDGVPNNRVNALELSKELKSKNVKLAIIGIGQKINHSYNKILAGCDIREPNCKFYSHANWNEAVSIINPFINKVCTEVERVANCGSWGEWSPCTVTCGKGTKSRSRPSMHEKCTTHMISECEEEACPVEPLPVPVPAPIPSNPEDTTPRNNDDDDDHPNFRKGLDVPDDVENDTPPVEDNNNEENPKESNDFPPADDSVPDEENVIPLVPAVPSDTNDDLVSEAEKNISENPEEPQVEEVEQVEQPSSDETTNEKTANPSNHDKKREQNIPKTLDNEKDINNNNKGVHPNKNDHSHDRYPKPHTSSNAGGYNNRPSVNSDIPNTPVQSEYESQDNGKKSTNNGYKIAGGVIAGLALVGCVGFAYNFIAHGSAAAMGGEPAPFDEAMAEDDKETGEGDQFKLPEDNDWN
ncbi:thrombospondin-related anonymous protein [Plasmodium gonderi]|uniref:Thrombospondin-related anonymous protein n=1 Tax=Plasmodium gonderi TaxID=77519 RepID=A0A1Y1JKP1_PLAGO|nr:thrombospondin-related anonymous protein [Plasmodium gonderi]GAW82208.1 thrombospondin-related anonymous protein [Plasmodium gonderi]